ncbi:hypothetical protein ABZT47_23120 [Sphaerisporangium sp. NPDC005289]|uniref:hypothetical protein n=1 Tax=Sphaerisporangium sp. NPDC005289 TaxID=3155247 RepID=UPI0033BC47D5
MPVEQNGEDLGIIERSLDDGRIMDLDSFAGDCHAYRPFLAYAVTRTYRARPKCFTRSRLAEPEPLGALPPPQKVLLPWLLEPASRDFPWAT